MVDEGHENGRIRAFAEACFENGEVAKVFVVPGLSCIGYNERLVCAVGDDGRFVSDTEIAWQRLDQANPAILEFLVSNHLYLKRVFDGFENRSCRILDDVVVVV